MLVLAKIGESCRAMGQKLTKAEELFFVVDSEDRPLNPLPRKLVHGHGVWHRVSHVWVVNNKGMILCQQRALSKENNPGYWEPFFGGHLAPNESYLDGALREIKEEINLRLEASELKLWKIYKFLDPKNGYNNEFQAIFLADINDSSSDFRFNDEEVDSIAWKPISVVTSAIKNAKIQKWTHIGYEEELLSFLSK
jgi:8-oxo-dGTP diphosphatase